MDDWDAFDDVMINSNDDQEKDNERCWMQRQLTGCAVCPPCMVSRCDDLNHTLPAS